MPMLPATKMSKNSTREMRTASNDIIHKHAVSELRTVLHAVSCSGGNGMRIEHSALGPRTQCNSCRLYRHGATEIALSTVAAEVATIRRRLVAANSTVALWGLVDELHHSVKSRPHFLDGPLLKCCLYCCAIACTNITVPNQHRNALQR
jgi:hypothetical protein